LQSLSVFERVFFFLYSNATHVESRLGFYW
jgi:hypothetical protein